MPTHVVLEQRNLGPATGVIAISMGYHSPLRAVTAGNTEAPRRPMTFPAKLPRTVRKEIFQLARTLAREHRQLFVSNPTLRKRAGQFLTALLPPKPRRRGRPGNPAVTKAIRLRRLLRRQYPDEQWAKIWERIYPQVIPNYAALSDHEQKHAREVLRERVRWRLKIKKPRKSLDLTGNIPA